MGAARCAEVSCYGPTDRNDPTKRAGAVSNYANGKR
jgi:hypothetical protein